MASTTALIPQENTRSPHETEFPSGTRYATSPPWHRRCEGRAGPFVQPIRLRWRTRKRWARCCRRSEGGEGTVWARLHTGAVEIAAAPGADASPADRHCPPVAAVALP